MKKVLFAIYAMGFGGAERSLANLLNELPKDQYKIDLLLFRREGAFLEQLPEHINVLQTPDRLGKLYSPLRKAGWMGLYKIVGTSCARIMRKKAKAQGAFRWKHFYRKQLGPILDAYDVAVAYVGADVLYLVRDCIQADKKLVWIHNDYQTAGYSAEDDREYFADMHGIVSVSEGCVNALKETFPEYEDKITCVENITSSALVRKLAMEYEPVEYKNASHKLLSIGRLNQQKGFDVAISAAAIMKKNRIDFRWYIIGEGSLRHKLEQQIIEEHVEDCVIMLGTRTNPYPYIKNCTILVQPSRWEGKSVVLDESKILCTPIAATNYPTVRDQILEDREGVIMSMTPEGIAQGLMKFLVDEEKQVQIRSYLADHEYGNQKEVAKYIELLG